MNSPGADCGATCGAGDVGVGATGPELIGAIPPELENIFVNSPGAECGATCGVGGVGVGEAGEVVAAAAAGSGAALPPMELNMRVNEPGPDLAGAPAPALGTWETVEIPDVGSFGGFSIATGLKTCATSSVRPMLAPGAALGPALPLAPGIVSACSMRVNSPGPDCAGAAGVSAAAIGDGGVGVGVIGVLEICAATGCGVAAATAFDVSGSSGCFSGVAWPRSEANRSSSARGAAGTCPKTPVALEGCSVLGESDGSNGFLGTSMRGHLAW